MKELREVLENIISMTDSDWDFFSSKLYPINFKKKTILIELGVTEKYLSFITKGMVRYCIPKDENDLTFGFLFKNDFVTAYDSFITQSPSEYQIETLTACTLWRISYDDLQEVYAKTSVGNVIGRRMAENMFLIKSKRELSLLNKTAEERYLELFTDRPILLKEIPLKYIASYIGITPQALSRIRKRIF